MSKNRKSVVREYAEAIIIAILIALFIRKYNKIRILYLRFIW